MTILLIEDTVAEGTDFWLVAAVAVPRPGTAGPVLLVQSDISGSIALNVYLPSSSVAVYSTTFVKTLQQNGSSLAAIHAATVDSLWEDVDTIGHNFIYHITEADLTAGLLKGGRRYSFVFGIPTTRDGTVKVVFEATIAALH